jgi:hypothetical protein
MGGLLMLMGSKWPKLIGPNHENPSLTAFSQLGYSRHEALEFFAGIQVELKT